MILNLFDKAYEVAENTSVGDLLKAQMPDDWKKYLVVRLEDGTLCDLFSPIAHSQTVTPLTFDDPDGRKVFFHSASHLMAMAVKHLFPEAKLAIGPAHRRTAFTMTLIPRFPSPWRTLPRSKGNAALR